jgi:hypothetical protein
LSAAASTPSGLRGSSSRISLAYTLSHRPSVPASGRAQAYWCQTRASPALQQPHTRTCRDTTVRIHRCTKHSC